MEHVASFILCVLHVCPNVIQLRHPIDGTRRHAHTEAYTETWTQTKLVELMEDTETITAIETPPATFSARYARWGCAMSIIWAEKIERALKQFAPVLHQRPFQVEKKRYAFYPALDQAEGQYGCRVQHANHFIFNGKNVISSHKHCLFFCKSTINIQLLPLSNWSLQTRDVTARLNLEVPIHPLLSVDELQIHVLVDGTQISPVLRS